MNPQDITVFAQKTFFVIDGLALAAGRLMKQAAGQGYIGGMGKIISGFANQFFFGALQHLAESRVDLDKGSINQQGRYPGNGVLEN